MKICICGGGALGHVCAGVFSTRDDVELCIYSGHPESWGKTILVKDLAGRSFEANIAHVSNDPEEVIRNQDLILLCLPGFLIEKTLQDIKPYIGDAYLGSIVSSTGFFFMAHKILGEGARLFGFQRVPFIARVAEYGKSAKLLGYKPSLSAVFENIPDPEAFRAQLEQLFLTPVKLLDNYLEVSLTNSNPILHTGRLYTLFHGREDNLFDHKILFYKEWTDEASQMLIEMDAEFAKLLETLRISSIPSLLDYYESTDARSLTNKISSIPAFQTIESPMIEVSGGWKADFSSRYFTEDFPFGLRWIKELSEKNQVETPVIDKVYNWGMSQL